MCVVISIEENRDKGDIFQAPLEKFGTFCFAMSAVCAFKKSF